MDKTTEYLQDEVRSGFYIPTAIKQAWATQLKILSEIDRICSKYNVDYYAEWGTLLGAVRHGGYVPWDDDLDIGMKRKDYIKFLDVAKEELPEGYVIHNYESKDNHWLFLARVVNTDNISFEKKHLDNFYNFPYIATVDIFVSDYRYADDDRERTRCEEIKHILAVADGIVSGRLTKTAREVQLMDISKRYDITINNTASDNDIGKLLYKIAEEIMAKVSYNEADNIVQMFPWGLKGSIGLPKEYYEEFVRLPFEDTTIPVPAKYHEVLKARYGDYMKVHKVWGGHDYPYFEGQRANLQAVADIKLQGFIYDERLYEINIGKKDRSSSLKVITDECMTELKDIANFVKCTIEDNKISDIIFDRLTIMQQLAIELGTLIEKVKGEYRECTKIIVSQIEQFCEIIYILYEVLTDASDRDVDILAQDLSDSLDKVSKTIKCQLIDRKEILFVVCGANRWKGFADIYEEYMWDTSIDVNVVAVPVLRKDICGQILGDDNIEYIYEGYPDEVVIDRWDIYDVAMHCPDIIYIQDPYDDANPCLTIPDSYYARNLKRYTDSLIYVPPYMVEEFGQGDITEIYNMKHYVCAPAVVYSDKIMVQSENMRQRYIEKLSEFAGIETKEIWARKICVRGYVNKGDNTPDNKKVVFGIGLNEIAEHTDGLEKVIYNRMSIFKEYSDKIDLYVCLYPEDSDKLEKVMYSYQDKGWYHLLKGDEYKVENIVKLVDICDAYYGSPMPLAHYFERANKPVMLANFSG